MPIKFTCPNCASTLQVKDELAGKRGNCPKCKSPVTVPRASAGAPPARRPGATPPPPTRKPADVEAEAAALLADEPQQQDAPADTIDFTCPYCDQLVHVDSALAGKRTPCPNPDCRRIIPVPMPTSPQAKQDWRSAGPKLPAAARRPDEPAPEGAWGSVQKSGPSQEALIEAGVIKEKKKPRSFAQKAFPYLMAGGLLGGLLIGGGVLWSMRARHREERALKLVEGYVDSEQAGKQLGVEGRAALHLGAGQYHLRGRKAGSAPKAAEELGKALDLLRGARPGGEREPLLIEVALAFVDLGGSPPEVEDKVRLKWNDAFKSVQSVVGALAPGDAQLEGLRLVSRRLIDRGQAGRVAALAARLHVKPGPDQSEALAVAGLEMLRAGERGPAEDLARRALAVYNSPPAPPKDPPGGKKPPADKPKDKGKEKGKGKDRGKPKEKEKPKPPAPPPLRPAVVALAEALNQKLPAPAKREPDEVGRDESALLLGQVEALARKGDWAKAKDKASAAESPRVRARAFTTLADAATDSRKDAAAEFVESAMRALENRQGMGWVMYRLTHAAIGAGAGADRLRALADHNPDRGLRAWSQLAVFRSTLQGAKGVQDVDTAKPVDAKSVAHRVALMELARHNVRADGGWAKNVDSWDEADRAFGSLGVAMGMQKEK